MPTFLFSLKCCTLLLCDDNFMFSLKRMALHCILTTHCALGLFFLSFFCFRFYVFFLMILFAFLYFNFGCCLFVFANIGVNFPKGVVVHNFYFSFFFYVTSFGLFNLDLSSCFSSLCKYFLCFCVCGCRIHAFYKNMQST
jgi:hypothetical protein